MHKPLAIFDVDGTLVDSRAVIHRCCRDALVAVGRPDPSYDHVRQVVGLGLAEALTILAPGAAGSELDRLVQAYKDAFGDLHATPGFIEPLYEGAAACLDRLRSQGWRLAVATGKTRRGLETIVAMHGWADQFHSTHCDDDGPGKPHPAMILAAMKALGAAPSETVMIGDTSHDMKMALAAGVYAQGVAWGFHTPDEVALSGARHVAHSFAELDAALDRFAAKEIAHG